MNSTEKKNALIGEIGALMLSDSKLAKNPWDAISLVAKYANGKGVSGYRYYGDDYNGWIPEALEVDNKLAELQNLMKEERPHSLDAQSKVTGYERICILASSLARLIKFHSLG